VRQRWQFGWLPGMGTRQQRAARASGLPATKRRRALRAPAATTRARPLPAPPREPPLPGPHLMPSSRTAASSLPCCAAICAISWLMFMEQNLGPHLAVHLEGFGGSEVRGLGLRQTPADRVQVRGWVSAGESSPNKVFAGSGAARGRGARALTSSRSGRSAPAPAAASRPAGRGRGRRKVVEGPKRGTLRRVGRSSHGDLPPVPSPN
jgi:hypothetical protein